MVLPLIVATAPNISFAMASNSIPAIAASSLASSLSIGVVVGELKFIVSLIMAQHIIAAVLTSGTRPASLYIRAIMETVLPMISLRKRIGVVVSTSPMR